MIRSRSSPAITRAATAALLLAAGWLAGCSSAGTAEAFKSTVQTVNETKSEIDRTARAPFQTKDPIQVSSGKGQLGPAALPFDEVQIRKAVERYAEGRKQKAGGYIAAGVKLTPDGKLRVLVLFTSQDWCQPQGCEMAILEPGTYVWRSVGSISRVRAPVLVGSTVSNGWYDLWASTGREAKGKDKDAKSFVQNVHLPHGANGYPGTTTFATSVTPAGAKPEGQAVFLSAEQDIPDKARFATGGRDPDNNKKKKKDLLSAAQPAKPAEKAGEKPTEK